MASDGTHTSAQGCTVCTAPLRRQDRFCATCGTQLEHFGVRDAAEQPTRRMNAVRTPLRAPQADWASPANGARPVAAPAGAEGQGDSAGLASALIAMIVIAIAAVAVVVMLAVSHADDRPPTLVDNQVPTITVPRP